MGVEDDVDPLPQDPTRVAGPLAPLEFSVDGEDGQASRSGDAGESVKAGFPPSSYEILPRGTRNILDGIIRNTPVSVCVSDPALPGVPLIAVSDSFLTLCGYSRAEVVGQNCRLLNQDCGIAPEQRALMRKVSEDSTGHATFEAQIANRRKDGSVFSNLLRLRSIYVAGRRFVIGTQSDAGISQVSDKDLRSAARAMWSKARAPGRKDSEEGQAASQSVQRVSFVAMPKLLTPVHRVEDSLVIILDHRLTSSVVTAMGEGAVSARLCATVAETKKNAASYRADSLALCGELHHRRAEGFDFDTSPLSYVGAMSHGPSLMMVGSNAARAIAWARRAKILVLGSFLNLSGLVELIFQQQPMPVLLLCAGRRRGEQSRPEDELLCAYLLHILVRTADQPSLLLFDDAAREVMQRLDQEDLWQSCLAQVRRGESSLEVLRLPRLACDVDFCLELDRYSRLLPWYSPFFGLFLRRLARDEPGIPKAVLPLHPSIPPFDAATGSGSPTGGDASSSSVRITAIDDRSNGGPTGGPRRDGLSRLIVGGSRGSPAPIARKPGVRVRFFLVRHANYEETMVQGMAGHLDPILSEEGFATAHRCAAFLAKEPLEILLCSPMIRAQQTADLIARYHKGRGLMTEIDRSLKPINRGDWEGLSPKQVQEHFPGQLASWISNPDFKDHGGDSFNELVTNMQATLNRLLARVRAPLAQSERPVAVCIVAHSSTVASLVTLMQSGPPRADSWTEVSKSIPYAGVSVIEFEDDGGGRLTGRVVYIGKVVRDEDVEAIVPDAPISVQNREVLAEVEERTWEVPRGTARPAPSAALAGEAPRYDRLDFQCPVSIVTLPQNISPEHELNSSLVVLVDGIRMSSSIVTGMGAGLHSAQLFSSVMEVTHAMRKYGSDVILAGETKRVLIPGFDRDNSPRSYLNGVEGRTALWLTTNGTRAMPWVKNAKLLILGCFMNMSAIVRTIIMHLRDVKGVLFVCAGSKRGTVRSDDDELVAGYLLRTLLQSYSRPSRLLLDEVAISVLSKIYSLNSWKAVEDAFRCTPAAEGLRKVQMADDVDFIVVRDRYRDMLPFYVNSLDLFVSHRVHYGANVYYGAEEEPVPCLSAGIARSTIQAFLVWQDDISDLFEPEDNGEDQVTEPATKRRLKDLIQSFGGDGVSLLACSPSLRCRTAAQLIVSSSAALQQDDHHTATRLVPEVYNGLSAVRSGDLTGLTAGEAEEHFPGTLHRWRMDPDWNDHGGESYRQVHMRVTETFYRLLNSHTSRNCRGALVVVTHGAAAHAIVASARQLSVSQAAAAWGTLKIGGTTLIEVSRERGPAELLPTPEGCLFRVSSVGKGATSLVSASSPTSRL